MYGIPGVFIKSKLKETRDKEQRRIQGYVQDKGGGVSGLRANGLRKQVRYRGNIGG